MPVESCCRHPDTNLSSLLCLFCVWCWLGQGINPEWWFSSIALQHCDILTGLVPVRLCGLPSVSGPKFFWGGFFGWGRIICTAGLWADEESSGEDADIKELCFGEFVLCSREVLVFVGIFRGNAAALLLGSIWEHSMGAGSGNDCPVCRADITS